MGQVTDPALLDQLNSHRAPQRAPVTFPTLPNPDMQHDNSVQDAQLENSNTQTQLSVENQGREYRQNNIQAASQLRGDYNQSPDVRNYHAALPLLTGAMKASNDGQGDLSLVYAYAKMMDPTTGVRDGEMDNVGNTGSIAGSTYARLKGQLDNSGGRFSPEVRNGLIQEMIHKARGFRQAYNLERKRYGDNAQIYGIDPSLVIGPDVADPFREDMAAYDKQRGIGRFAGDRAATPNGGPVMPGARDITPEGTQAVFGGQDMSSDGNGITSHADAIQQLYGISVPDEDWMVGFWNANTGNPNLTVEGVRASYRASGLPNVASAADRISAADIQSRIDAAKKGIPAARYDTSEAEKGYLDKLRADMAANGFDPVGGTAHLDRILQNLPFHDETAGLMNAAVQGSRGYDPVAAYKQTRDTERLKLLDEQNTQGVTGKAFGALGALPAMFVGGEIATPLKAAKVGAGYGAMTGFDEGHGFSDSVRGGIAGGVLGGVTGAGAQKLIDVAAPYVGAGVRRVLGRDGAAVADAPVTGVTQGGPTAYVSPETVLPAADQAEIAALAKKATGWGPGARAAKQQLAERFAANPEAAAAAQRLGIDLPPDVLADNAQAQSLTGLARSQVGSEAETAWKADAKRVSEYANQAMQDLGASPDLAQLSDDVLTRLKGTAQHLEDKADALRTEVDAAITPSARVEAPNLQETLAKTINDYGGLSEAKAAMTTEEKGLLTMLGEGDAAKMPTYARLNRIRQDVGRAMSKGTGPWADVNQAQLKRYYKALRSDQLAAVGQLGGAELAAKQEAANGLFSQMYDQRQQLQELFGKNLEKSVTPLLNRAVTTGAKGDATALNTLIERLPEDTRGPALISAIMSKAQTSAAHGGFSFANYTKLYRGLRENGPVFAKVAKAIGPKATAVLNDLHVVSSRMADAETRVLKTGKANQGLDAAMKAEGIVGGVLNAVAEKGSTGAGAVLGGVVGGPGGAAVGAGLGASAQKALIGGGASRLDKVHALFSSPQFKATIGRIAQGEDAGQSLWDNIAFHNLGRSLGLLTPQARREWLTRLTSMNPLVGDAAQSLQRAANDTFATGSRAAAADGQPDQSGAKPTTIPVPR